MRIYLILTLILLIIKVPVFGNERKLWIFPSIKTGQFDKAEFTLTNYYIASKTRNHGPMLSLGYGTNTMNGSVSYGFAGTPCPGTPIELIKNTPVGSAVLGGRAGIKYVEVHKRDDKFDKSYWGPHFLICIGFSIEINYLMGNDKDKVWALSYGFLF
ncbi:MAG: hypothetical protein JW983_09240 [Elusimicrobia bacterium]|nr:hypothetical protein [Elusimicrobiota bacterium]